MAPRAWSRYLFCWGLRNENGDIGLTEREPFLYQELPDNRSYTVADGDTLFSIAERAFPSFPHACGLFWIIADFQPEPMQDATLALETGTRLIIPSERTVRELIFDEARRTEFSQ
jgi:hypothetical protein